LQQTLLRILTILLNNAEKCLLQGFYLIILFGGHTISIWKFIPLLRGYVASFAFANPISVPSRRTYSSSRYGISTTSKILRE